MTLPATIAELRASGYVDRTVKEELRTNLLARLGTGERLFPQVVGFDDSVLPVLERGILAGHDLIMLGERGQAKTRLIRRIVDLLDERDAGDRRLRGARPPLPSDLRAMPVARRRGRRRGAAAVGRAARIATRRSSRRRTRAWPT